MNDEYLKFLKLVETLKALTEDVRIIQGVAEQGNLIGEVEDFNDTYLQEVRKSLSHAIHSDNLDVDILKEKLPNLSALIDEASKIDPFQPPTAEEMKEREKRQGEYERNGGILR